MLTYRRVHAVCAMRYILKKFFVTQYDVEAASHKSRSDPWKCDIGDRFGSVPEVAKVHFERRSSGASPIDYNIQDQREDPVVCNVDRLIKCCHTDREDLTELFCRQCCGSGQSGLHDVLCKVQSILRWTRQESKIKINWKADI